MLSSTGRQLHVPHAWYTTDGKPCIDIAQCQDSYAALPECRRKTDSLGLGEVVCMTLLTVTAPKVVP